MKNSADRHDLENLMYNIKQLRVQHGMSKKEMAQLLGVSVWTINKIEKGEFPPRLNIEVVFSLSAHFGISFEELLERKLDSCK